MLRNPTIDEILSNRENILTIGRAQLAPVWMDRAAMFFGICGRDSDR